MPKHSRAYYVVRSIVRVVVALAIIAAIIAAVGALESAFSTIEPFTYGTH